MKFRNLIFVLMVAFSAIFATMIGTSYAYYVSTGGTFVEATTGNIENIGVAVTFAQSEYINVNTAIPITAAEVATRANKSVFTVTPDNTVLNDADVAINFSLANFSVSSALRVADFKYKLVCNDGTKDIELVNSDGTSFTDAVISSGSLNLGTLTNITSDESRKLDLTKSYTCGLSVWILETGENQNALMNKRVSGLIRVNTLFKTKVSE